MCKDVNRNPYYSLARSHHTPTGFQNTETFTLPKKNVLKWLFLRIIKRLPKAPLNGYKAFKQQWWQRADFSSANDDAIWWLGHATTLIRLNGLIIITDPMFSKYASPLQFFGTKRKMPPPTTIANLPQIDVIAISHNHYDHLDYHSIRQLKKHFPHATLLVPLGLKQCMQKWGISHVIEMDWWQQQTIGSVVFTCTPARHWSQRTLFDRYKSLWCSWLFQSNNKNVFFMGDSGYTPVMREIKNRYGAMNVAALAIGAYAPRWMMKSQHIDPDEAVKLFQDLECKQAIAIHWGTFEMADERLDEPPLHLEHALQKAAIPQQRFLINPIGGKLNF